MLSSTPVMEGPPLRYTTSFRWRCSARAPSTLIAQKNMVPVCSGCHACLHRGRVDLASAILDEVLRWFETIHGVSFESANMDLGFDLTPAGLLKMYGSDIPI